MFGINSTKVWFKEFFNFTSYNAFQFSAGFVEGSIIANFSSTRGELVEALPLDQVKDQTSTAAQAKAKVLAISVGGAVVKTAPTIVKVISGATPNLLI